LILISSVCSIDASTDCGIDDVNTGVNNSMCTVLYVYWVLFRNESVLILIYVVFSTEASTDGGNDDVNNGVSNGTCTLLYITLVSFWICSDANLCCLRRGFD